MASHRQKRITKRHNRGQNVKATASEMSRQEIEAATSEIESAEIDSADLHNEDYNIRSPERSDILFQIKKIIGSARVSPAFWACCQLADLGRLKTMAKLDRQTIFVIQSVTSSLVMECKLLLFRTGRGPIDYRRILTVGRESAIPGFEIPRIRACPTTSSGSRGG